MQWCEARVAAETADPVAACADRKCDGCGDVVHEMDVHKSVGDDDSHPSQIVFAGHQSV